MVYGYRTPKFNRPFNFSGSPIPFKLYSSAVKKPRNWSPRGLKLDKKPVVASGVLTTQNYDKRVMYRKRRAPLRIRRRAKKAYRRFVRQSLKLVGTNTVVFNSSVSSSTNNTTAPQNMLVVNVAGTNGNGSLELGSGDINSLVSNDARIASSGKVLMKTAMADMTIRNLSASVACEVDVYEISYRDTTKFLTFRQMVDSATGNTPNINTSGNGLNIVTRGVQLFDIPELFKYGITVLKKTKVFLPAGNTATYSLHNRKPQWFSTANDLIDNNGFVKRGYTRTIACVYKPVVNTTNDVVSLGIGVTRKYMYKIFEDDRDADQQL